MNSKNLRLLNPLYINANIIFSECIQNHKGKLSGTLQKLSNEEFTLVTSALTKAEVIQKLCCDKNISILKARDLYQNVTTTHNFATLYNIQQIVNINDVFFENFCTSRLSLGDFLHLSIAKHLNIPICTHDKKMLGKSHNLKSRFYEKVYKPEELIKEKITSFF